MTPYAWRCLVCDASNRAADSVCHQCGAPDQMGAQEMAARRLQWKGASPSPAWGRDFKWGIAGKLGLLLGGYVLLIIGLMALGASSGSNSLAVAMFGGMLFLPVPFLFLAWIVAVVRFWWKRIKK